MAKKRLIPKLLLSASKFNSQKLVVVITKQFNERIEIGDPVSQAKIFQDQSADELVFINIDSSNNDINKLAQVISKVSEEIFMPMTVGGGVNSETDFRLLLQNGADKISINTKAVNDPEFIKMASQKYGAQCVVVSIDYKLDEKGEYKVYTNGGKIASKYHPVEFALLAEEFGAGELMLTSIDNDGMRNGINLEITRQIEDIVKIPIISGGGCGLAKHFSDGFLIGKADAICAGSFFAHRDQNLVQTRAQIVNAGVNIRVHN
jgi:cyclase